MSFCYGPIIFPGPGTIVTVSIQQSTRALVVENESPFDILLSTSTASPQQITQAQASNLVAAGLPITSGGWDIHVGPRETTILTVGDQSLTGSAGGSYWSGTVYAQQIGIPNFETTAGSIVPTSGPNLWLTAFGPGEAVPDASIHSLGLLPFGQNRNVSIPVGPAMTAFAQGVTPGATGTFTNFGSSVNIGNYPFSNSALTAGLAIAGEFFIMVYFLSTTMQPLSGVAGTAESQSIQIRIAVFDSSSALVGTSQLLMGDYFAHLALQSMCTHVIAPARPNPVVTTIVAGAGAPYTLQPQLQVFGASGGGGTNIKSTNVQINYDIAAEFPTGAMGGAAGINPGGNYSGFIF